MLELDGDARVITYEEHFPFGGTALHAADGTVEVSAKRYRNAGHERDEESGLDPIGARYLAPWLGCWTSADPAGLVDGTNLYRYVRNDPIGFVDPTGTDSLALTPAAKAGAKKAIQRVVIKAGLASAVPAGAPAIAPAAAPAAAGLGVVLHGAASAGA